MNKNYPYNLLKDLKIPEDEAINFKANDLNKKVEDFLNSQVSRTEGMVIKECYKFGFSPDTVAKHIGASKGQVAGIKLRVIERMRNSDFFRRNPKIT